MTKYMIITLDVWQAEMWKAAKSVDKLDFVQTIVFLPIIYQYLSIMYFKIIEENICLKPKRPKITRKMTISFLAESIVVLPDQFSL